jgi:hypothetical protein
MTTTTGNGGGGGGGGGDDADEGPGLADPAILGTGRAALEVNKSHLAFLCMANNDGLTEEQADHVLAFLRTLPAEHGRTPPYSSPIVHRVQHDSIHVTLARLWVCVG